MLHLRVPFARSSTGLRQLPNLASVPFAVRKAQRWCFVFPFTRATDTSTRPILPATTIPFAPLQPLSCEVPEKCSLRREVERLRLKCDTGGTLSWQPEGEPPPDPVPPPASPPLAPPPGFTPGCEP